MPTGVVTWSQTAATNANADSNVNWAEGMAPSAVNDSARAEMASVAKWRDDNNGSIISGGSANAYTVTTNQTFASLTNGLTVAFSALFTNTGTCTLNVDGLGAVPLRIEGGVEAPAGAIIANRFYKATYRSASNQWILFDAPAGTPSGSVMCFAGSTAPAGWLICNGAAVSRTTYAALFAIISTTYGAGDGSTTFNLPDCTGRTVAGKESSETRITTAVSGFTGATLGAAGGSQSHTLVTGEIPSHTHTGTTASNGAHTHQIGDNTTGGAGSITGNANSNSNTGFTTTSNGAHTHTFTTDAAGGGGAHRNVQPTIILNYIIKT